MSSSLGFAAPSSSALRQAFSAVDADGSKALTPEELQTALLNLNGNRIRFHLDTVKTLMGIFDTDHNGTINYMEFAGIWTFIVDWRKIFCTFDRDQSGYIDEDELTDAILDHGYRMTPSLQTLVQQKYAAVRSTDFYGRSQGITFDHFVDIMATVEKFQKADER
ncbi:hypothetical protein BD626DRAFT_43380 [Schizophyllum amplum]|uniref:EF-hand domain-containing protein n=1 Tax=Schizophyllum amplum TaxID=97359 RepID=A0A550CDP7_9AGAR|nr:hypothetical protein BD626DRAFT_43380 [Auriculariopsis ampla]